MRRKLPGPLFPEARENVNDATWLRSGKGLAVGTVAKHID